MGDYNNLKKAFLVLLGGTLTASILGFISIGMVARGLGLESFGIFAIITSYLLIIDKLVNFQSWQALIKFGSIAQESSLDEPEKKMEIQKVSAFCFSIDIFTALIGFLLAIFLAAPLCSYFEWNNDIYFMILIYSCSMLFKFSSFGIGLFRLLNRHSLQAKIIVISAIVKFILTFIAFVLEQGLLIYLIIWGGTDILLNLLITFYAFILLNSVTGSKKPFSAGLGFNKKLVHFVLWTNLSGLIDLPAKELDVMFVGILTSEKEAGLYKLAKQVMAMVGRLVSPLYQSIYPIQARNISKGTIQAAITLTNKVSIKLFSASAVVILLGYFALGDIVILILGEGYRALIPIALLALIVKSLDAIFTSYHSLFIAFGYVKQNVLILLFANTLLIIGFYITIPKWGVDAALYCIAFQAFITLILKLIYIKKRNLHCDC
ncbi:oligosaccharide flippase family protein [Colwellia sp. MB02u-10]|uniref:lipopolysaccharide biosynthesis protein n=1 Tax=Colwellia sp. MB02u-10 TaxID=2759828 RepID=UPI0015F6ED2A|nr:oligosaccharide flippase family protein [Colwellia sp. MB02u-10]MBA6342127.1 oligosaccharide flippase family protein [Colwellia sp. MB02u-10]